jgi:RNA polymerase sigma factor (sigma-70 family)
MASEDQMGEIQSLLDRLNEGDSAARDELIGRLYPRLVRLAQVIQQSFPDLVGCHGPESVLHTGWERLSRAIDKEKPATVADLFGLAGHKIRQVLLDMAERERHRIRVGVAIGAGPTASSAAPPPCLEDSTYDPSRLALWTELHRKVDELPPDEREVFTLRYCSGLNQGEIASSLGIHPKQVSRLWIRATKRLAKELSGFESFL